MFGLSDAQLNEIFTVLKAENIAHAWIFGSRAKGNYKPGSDVDLAIIGDADRIAYLLNEETFLPYYFDVIDMQSLNNQALKEHIARVGVQIK